MKVIFWDVDGCLNTPDTWGAWSLNGSDEAIEPTLVARARQLHLDTGAMAVLSSTWRLSKMSGGYPGTVQCLKRRGWPEAEDVFVGETPYLAGGQRGQEIAFWLMQHPEVTSFAIVDDATDMLGVAFRHVHIDFTVGVTEADCDAVKRLLL